MAMTDDESMELSIQEQSEDREFAAQASLVEPDWDADEIDDWMADRGWA
jgi:hypothetical protein